MTKFSCQEVLDHLADYLDEEARAELVLQVDQHLGACHNCRVEVDTIKHTIMFYRAEERVFLSPALTERLSIFLKGVYEHCPDEDKSREV